MLAPSFLPQVSPETFSAPTGKCWWDDLRRAYFLVPLPLVYLAYFPRNVICDFTSHVVLSMHALKHRGLHVLNIYSALSSLIVCHFLPYLHPFFQHMPFPVSIIPLCSVTHLLFLPFLNILHPLLAPLFCSLCSSCV